MRLRAAWFHAEGIRILRTREVSQAKIPTHVVVLRDTTCPSYRSRGARYLEIAMVMEEAVVAEIVTRCRLILGYCIGNQDIERLGHLLGTPV